MKHQKLLLLFTFFIVCIANAQVKTNQNNLDTLTTEGYYKKKYKEVVYAIAMPDTNGIKKKDKDYYSNSGEKPFRFAEPLPVKIDVVKEGSWIYDGATGFLRFALTVRHAKSLSINFGQFHLPSGTEMFIYNEKGKMITGPITETENNKNNVWGSSVYKGDMLTIELKTPASTKDKLKLVIENIAFGYKEIYGYGTSSGCNINILCALGNGWDLERNSVALVLNQDGSSWCSGALVNNTCNINIPNFLTADHCFTGQDVGRWRFVFQYLSPNCSPSSDDLTNLLFNGSTLRANDAGTDFALVELNQTPQPNSGLALAGWSRNTTGIQQTTIIHHPSGDVMKISRDNDAPNFSTFLGAQCWQLGLDQGATNGGSSGSPYFDQNHRIIGQHYGTVNNSPDACLNTIKHGGRFDLSWTGGGTNATRLSNWLDPIGSGALTTNTTSIAALTNLNGLSISGPGTVVCTSGVFTLNGTPTGSTTTWSIDNNLATITPSGNTVMVTKNWDGIVVLTATVNFCGISASTSLRLAIGNGGWTDIQPLADYSCYEQGTTYYFTIANAHPGVSYKWGYITPNGITIMDNWYTSSPNASFTFYNGGSYGIIAIPYNSCGEGTYYEYGIYVNNWGEPCYGNNYMYMVKASPNPTHGDAFISIVNEKDESRKLSKDENVFIDLYDINNQKLVRQWKFKNNQSKYKINTFGLRKGYYVVQVRKGKYQESTKILVE